jgi:DNA modification methylase
VSKLNIQYLPLKQLVPYPRNARLHSKKQIRQIADNIKKNGFLNPILIDDNNVVLAGHGRLAAAKLLDIDEVPCVPISGMSSAQKRAYRLADNRIAQEAGWDDELLAAEFQSLVEEDKDFDLGETGFSAAEVDRLLEELGADPGGNSSADKVPNLKPKRLVSRLGDIWEMGRHRLICGDALDPQTYARLLGDDRAQMVFTDAPYNVRINGHVGGLGAVQHDEFVMASGEMTPEEFAQFLTVSFRNLAAYSANGSIHFLCMDWRHLSEILAAGKAAYSELKNLCVWVKDNGGMGTFYRSRQELVFAYKSGTAPHINNFELGQYGRYRTNVWEYRGVNTLRPGRMEELALHPTVKPVDMIVDAIKDVSKRNGIVLDAFGGSGSTLIAAHKTGRRGYLIELDPQYVDCTIRRFQGFAHQDAVLSETGQTFDEILKHGRSGDVAPPTKN